MSVPAVLMMWNRKKFYSRYSIGVSEEVMQDRICESYLKKFGWCTMEVENKQGCRFVKEYLETECNKGELKSRKIYASGQGSKSSTK